MTATELTLDDLLHDVFSGLLRLPFDVLPTRAEKEGGTSEIFGALLHLQNPLARLSRTETKGTIFSALGELLWYLSGSDRLDFIKYYIKGYEDDSDDGKILYGAYGPRLMNSQAEHNQIENVIILLQRNPVSRRAVIQLFESRDIAGERKNEIPCTCTLQFVIRQGQLQLMAHMRSNDAFKGLPHDIFAFTMLQEILARTLGVELGDYHHSVGSLHLYHDKAAAARQYVDEGVQPTKLFMPPMPAGDPWNSIQKLLELEEKIRTDHDYNLETTDLEAYWLDLARLLEIFALTKKKDVARAEQVRVAMSSNRYDAYIARRIESSKKSDL